MEENKIVCSYCGQLVDANKTRVIDSIIPDFIVCDECFEDEYHKCNNCGKYFTEDDLSYHDDDHCLCEECASEYRVCDECGELVNASEMVDIDNGSMSVCESCADEIFYRCDDCGNYFSYTNLAYNIGNITLCECCGIDYLICSECDSVIHENYAYYDGDDNVFCQSCYEDRDSEVIQEYSYKPRPIFYQTAEESADEGYGLELEVDDGDSPNEAAQEVQDAGGDVIYIKHDGSLSNGFEIVTHPCSLAYHMQEMKWESITKAAERNGFKSHDTDTCGLHVHASRSLFGEEECSQDLAIAKVIILINKFWESHVVPFSRRDVSNLNRWAGKLDCDIKENDTDDDIIYKTKDKASRTRYVAVNLNNRNTVEFRIFRGVLKRDTIIATIQWVDVLIKYSKEASLKDVQVVKWEQIFGNSQYSELSAYLEEIGGKKLCA